MSYIEQVETCPYCGMENVYGDYDPVKSGYVAECHECGEKIFLCDACMHAEDNPNMDCDWHECLDGNRCRRGFIKKEKENNNMAKVIYVDEHGNQTVIREGKIYASDILFRDDYFATKLWHRDDIAMRIEDIYNREATEEEITEVINAGGKWWGLNDCNDGEWDCIDDVITSTLGYNKN